MSMTPQQRTALGGAILILLVLVLVGVVHHGKWMKRHCICNKLLPINPRPNPALYHTGRAAERFSGDDDNWPQAGSFGAYADTFPYANYADGLQTFYPTYDEYNPYWTRA